MTFVIQGADMAFVAWTLCAALVIAFVAAVYELEQLAKRSTKKRNPWDKK